MSGLFLFRRLKALACLAAAAAAPTSAPAADPITHRTDEVGISLNEWANQNRAAGLSAITYENRDGQHSTLPSHLWPGLKFHSFSTDDLTANRHKGPAREIRPYPTLGNCSMAAPADQGGSLPRLYFMDPGGNRFLAQQFLSNQLFIYPEHQDHDPGGNGLTGWGDLYPLNSPTLLISQGSSGSDQPFLQALLSTTAAFSPTLQRTLIERRLLAPTLQYLLRRHLLPVRSSADYLSSKAHPVVFDARLLNEKAMVQAAQSMRETDIPPVAMIDVLEETSFDPGAHYFEPAAPHPYRLSTTPFSVARLFRGHQSHYECILSTAKSGDPLKRPITIKTVVLQGDPALIEIRQQPDRPILRLKIRWHHPRSTASTLSPIRSHRVDIGIFADNGSHLSAPAILSLYMLPNERRFFDACGRLSEISFQASNPDLGLPNEDSDLRWIQVIQACIIKAEGLSSTLMERAFEPEERTALSSAYTELRTAEDQLRPLASDPTQTDATNRLRNALQDRLRTFLQQPLPGSRRLSARVTIETAFHAIARFPDLYLGYQESIHAAAAAAASAKPHASHDLQIEVQKLIDWGILTRHPSGRIVALRPAAQRTEAEHSYLTDLHLTALSHALFPEALMRDAGPAWVDPRLTTRKSWRDVHNYHPTTGASLGWLRYHAGRSTWFNPQGETLSSPPPTESPAVPVRYLPDPDQGLRFEPAK